MHIVLIHSAALGDTLLLIPLLRSLKLAFPTSHLTLVTHPAFGQLLTDLAVIDAACSADEPPHSRWFADPIADAISPVPAWARCNLLISAVSSGHDAWARHAAQFSTASQILFFQPRPPASFLRHVSDYHRQQLASAGLPLPTPPYPIVRQNPHGPIVIHPGAGSLAKCWPLQFYVQLAHHLSQHSLTPTFVLGPAELERVSPSAIAQIQSHFPTHLCPALTTLANILRPARHYLGNDSGPTHLAAALGIPTTVIFGPSNPAQWLPVGPPQAIHLLTPPPSSPLDLAALSPAVVLHSLLQSLTSPPPSAPSCDAPPARCPSSSHSTAPPSTA